MYHNALIYILETQFEWLADVTRGGRMKPFVPATSEGTREVQGARCILDGEARLDLSEEHRSVLAAGEDWGKSVRFTNEEVGIEDVLIGSLGWKSTEVTVPLCPGSWGVNAVRINVRRMRKVSVPCKESSRCPPPKYTPSCQLHRPQPAVLRRPCSTPLLGECFRTQLGSLARHDVPG